MMTTVTHKEKRILNIFFEITVVKYEIFYSQSLVKAIYTY